MKSKSILVSVFFLFALSQNVFAETITIEADDFAAGTNIGSYFPEISFYAGAFSGDNNVYAVTSIYANGQLGTNVLGNNMNIDSWPWHGLLQLTFGRYAKSVSVRVFESTEDTPYTSCTVRLYLYDRQGNIIDEDYVYNPQPQYKTLSITRQDYDIYRAGIYIQYAPACLDHIEVLLAPDKILVIQTEPNFIDTVEPNVGEHIYHLNSTVELSSGHFPLCPDVYQFDHWIGDVNDVNDPNTTIIMDSDKVVTAVFTATRECGDECHPNDLFGDYNHDCIIDFNDFAKFSDNWLICTKPECD